MLRPKTFGETIGPILLANVLFGVGCIGHVRKRGAKRSVKIVYFLVAISALACTIFYQYRLSAMYMLPPKVDLNLVFLTVWFSCTCIVVLVLIVATKFGDENVHDLIETIENVDEQMATIGLPKQYSSQYKYQMINFVLLLVYVFLYVTITWISDFKPNISIQAHVFLSVSLNLVSILSLMGHLSFCVWIRYVRTKLYQLNCLLAEMIDVLDAPKSERLREMIGGCPIRRRSGRHELRGNVQIIAKVKKYHLDWIKIARRVNRFYGIHVLASTSISFMTILYVLFILNCLLLRQSSADASLLEICSGLTVLSLDCVRVIHLHSKCRKTSDEARKTGYLLCLLYDSSTGEKFRAEVQNFTQQVLENPLVFTICGLVDFDRSFLANLFGSICTYVFVILQLRTQNMIGRRLSEATTSANVTLTDA
ncbi:uncharacterized protein LOC117226266 [Megalopta genalis]|uniref:uncharacterized protein LOC117226266 n=1 Tax=Megalopta genalis TaxID=115081 RepID=UPI003FD53CC8